MTRFIAPISFVVIAVGLFFGYIDPTYQELTALREEESRYTEALNKSRELEQVRDELLARYNSFESEDIARLEKLLPDNVDNVRLILDIDGIASRYGLRIRNVGIDRAAARAPGAIGPNARPYSSFQLSFSVTSNYEDFLLFMRDLEMSLRLVDVVNVSFNSGDVTDAYDFSVRIQTYWLE